MKFIVDTDEWTISSLGAEDIPNGAPVSWFDAMGFDLLSTWWLQASWQRKHSYHFQWLGRPIIQLPSDILLIQDLIFRLKPSQIIETGIAHGGSVVLHASLLSILHGTSDAGPHVIAIDIHIRPENRLALDNHPLRRLFQLIEGSSIDPAVVARARSHMAPDARTMIILDSNHSRDHVLQELELYSPLVTPGSAIVVMDTIMPNLANLPNGSELWKRDNPAAAIEEFLRSPAGAEFVVDHRYDQWKPTHSPGGILMRKSTQGTADE